LVFNAKYLSNEEIWSRIKGIVKERDRVQECLAEPEVSTDPDRMAELAKKLHGLNKFCLPVENLENILADIGEMEELITAEGLDEDEGGLLLEEFFKQREVAALQIYQMLLERGCLAEEIEDEIDLKILRFIDYAGPEYAWRLGINIGLDVEESRRRLEGLLQKGLLERVEGNMLGNYHREKSWTKHMNHTYYKMSREGRLYVRKLRVDSQEAEEDI